MKKRTQLPAHREPPEHLTEKSKALWRALVPRRVSSPSRLTLFQAALEALDRADQAREVIAQQGLTVRTATGAVRSHPATRIERLARAQFTRIWKQLGWTASERVLVGVQDA